MTIAETTPRALHFPGQTLSRHLCAPTPSPLGTRTTPRPPGTRVLALHAHRLQGAHPRPVVRRSYTLPPLRASHQDRAARSFSASATSVSARPIARTPVRTRTVTPAPQGTDTAQPSCASRPASRPSAPSTSSRARKRRDSPTQVFGCAHHPAAALAPAPTPSPLTLFEARTRAPPQSQ
ncbi:hypothetical protein B0H17DRAFT_1203515 [Mycena rosella]|uniref:Uncharacterized protein n=1 Tax=Mycena rosella TaxID=1033263 RepID=A0AAD7DBB7_MYCRO|nr:hypothetical protein B0H17DRAFT_1203515 [Mycena rosella]